MNKLFQILTNSLLAACIELECRMAKTGKKLLPRQSQVQSYFRLIKEKTLTMKLAEVIKKIQYDVIALLPSIKQQLGSLVKEEEIKNFLVSKLCYVHVSEINNFWIWCRNFNRQSNAIFKFVKKEKKLTAEKAKQLGNLLLLYTEKHTESKHENFRELSQYRRHVMQLIESGTLSLTTIGAFFLVIAIPILQWDGDGSSENCN